MVEPELGIPAGERLQIGANTIGTQGITDKVGECISVEFNSLLTTALSTRRDELLKELRCELFSYKIGGADGIRTHYLLTASQTLSQLSYSPA